jgi:hypothetical protein
MGVAQIEMEKGKAGRAQSCCAREQTAVSSRIVANPRAENEELFFLSHVATLANHRTVRQ